MEIYQFQAQPGLWLGDGGGEEEGLKHKIEILFKEMSFLGRVQSKLVHYATYGHHRTGSGDKAPPPPSKTIGVLAQSPLSLGSFVMF